MNALADASEPYPPLATDPLDEDTDGDTLEDGFEIGNVTANLTAGELVVYRPVNRPDREHSDSDDIDDSVEVRGWDINVTTTASGEPLRWNGQNNSTTIRATADPLAVHSDADEVPDGLEKRQLHTRANETVTYEVTWIHQQEVVAVLRARVESGIQGAAASVSAIASSARTSGSTSTVSTPSTSTTAPTTSTSCSTIPVTSACGRWKQRGGRTPVCRTGGDDRGRGVWNPATDGDDLTDGREE